MNQSEPLPAEKGLVITRHDSGDTACLQLQGEIDAANASLLRAAVDEVAAAGGVVELDFSGIKFMDSSGLGAIILAARRMQAAGGKLLLGERSPIVDRLFTVSGVERALASVDEQS